MRGNVRKYFTNNRIGNQILRGREGCQRLKVLTSLKTRVLAREREREKVTLYANEKSVFNLHRKGNEFKYNETQVRLFQDIS